MMRALTRQEIRELDRRAIAEYGIPGAVLMENAGRNTAQLILQQIEPEAPPAVGIFCGSGNNAGDGFVIARHLHNAGLPVQLILVGDVERLPDEARINIEIVRRMELPMLRFDEPTIGPLIEQCEIIIDALLGTGFSGSPRPPYDAAIRVINAADHAWRVAVDLPSGLDCDSGQPADSTVRADCTITFVARKIGFDAPAAEPYLGQVYVVDIGAPRELLDAHRS
ncbi:MAG: Bifunctional NAD(P)H-hydrate repair enzyme Nnr [Phycisphaerae bacterium]|nr:Bifunctional NAD(P)H-hydrate repair enzyme Nnr [Phycisphaerae bacterium]